MSKKYDTSVPQNLPSNGIQWEIIWDQSNFLTGRLLTIIDASIADKEQCKAVKDLIHSAIQDSKNAYHAMCFDRKKSEYEVFNKGIIFV